MKTLRMLFLAVLLVAVVVNAVFAGAGNRRGTGGATELLVPVGARDLAMGGSTIATTSGIEALFWNPAGSAKINNSATLMLSHMDYIADIGLEYGAVAANFEGFGVVSFNIKSLSVGAIAVTTTQNPDGTGQTFTPQFITAGATFARQLSDRIAVGITANLVTERLGDVSTSGFAFNAGVIYDNLGEVPGLSLGVAVKNIGPQMTFDGPGLYQLATVNDQNRPSQYYKIDSAPFELPSTLEFGIGYKSTLNDQTSLLLSSTFQNNNFSGDEYKVGGELAYNNFLFIRGGYSMSPKSQEDDYLYGLTAGAGLNYQMEGLTITVDYAYRAVKYFDGNNVFSVKLGF